MGYDYLKNAVEHAARYGDIDFNNELAGEIYDNKPKLNTNKTDTEFYEELGISAKSLKQMQNDEYFNVIESLKAELRHSNRMIEDLQNYIDELQVESKDNFDDGRSYRFAFEELAKVLLVHARN